MKSLIRIKTGIKPEEGQLRMKTVIETQGGAANKNEETRGGAVKNEDCQRNPANKNEDCHTRGGAANKNEDCKNPRRGS